MNRKVKHNLARKA